MRQDGSTKTRGSTRTRKERRTRRNEQIEFCQRCDTRLILMLGAAGSCVLACSKCGYEKAAKNFSLRFPEQTADDSIIIIGQKEAQLHVQPFIKIIAPNVTEREHTIGRPQSAKRRNRSKCIFSGVRSVGTHGVRNNRNIVHIQDHHA